MVDEFYMANCLRVSADTNGFCGGDAGHGSRTSISIEDLGGTSFELKPLPNGFTYEVSGDSELLTLYRAIKFIKFALEYYEPKLKEEINQ